jgi:hypothetical protein
VSEAFDQALRDANRLRYWLPEQKGEKVEADRVAAQLMNELQPIVTNLDAGMECCADPTEGYAAICAARRGAR